MGFFQKRHGEAGKPGGRAVYHHVPSIGATSNGRSAAGASGFTRFMDKLENNIWLMIGTTLGVTALILGWWLVSDQVPDGIRVFDRPEQTDTFYRPAVERLAVQLAGLLERVEMLTDSANELEAKLIRARALADSVSSSAQRAASTASTQPELDKAMRVVNAMAPPAAGQTTREPATDLTVSSLETKTASAAVGTTDTFFSQVSDDESQDRWAAHADFVEGRQRPNGHGVDGPPRTAEVTEYGAPASKHQNPVNEPRVGPWVINLTSSPSESDAHRFAANAQSRGIETRLQQVMVRGRYYWRVQTAGFSTAAEAQDYGATVKEVLGLQDVWIMQR